MIEQINNLVGSYVPQVIGALVVLIVGWFIAQFVSRIADRAVAKSGLANRIAGWFDAEQHVTTVSVAAWVRRLIFYLLILFVLVGFLQILGLTAVAEPLSRFLIQVFEYAPRLIGPAILLAVAWAAANVLRLIVRRALRASNLEQRLETEAGIVKSDGISLSHTLGDAIYWLTFLLFLPAILSALGLGGLLEPVQGMIGVILTYLPNLLAAGAILVIGWLVARILQRIVTNLLVAINADRLSEQVGLSKALGQQHLSSLVGLIVYILVLIPVLVGSLNALALDAITRPASEMLNTILSAIPAVFAAALVLAIAYFVGRVVAGLITNVLSGIGFDSILAKLGLGVEPAEGERTPSDVVGYLVLVAIMLFAIVEALRLIQFDLLAGLIGEFLVFAGQVILGLVIFAVGLYLAKLASDAVMATKINQAPLLAPAARIAIVVLASAMGLRQMGLANEIITVAFALLLGTIAVAAAVSFGIGGREVAADLISEWLDRAKSQRPSRSAKAKK
jgi:hypothetical protein